MPGPVGKKLLRRLVQGEFGQEDRGRTRGQIRLQRKRLIKGWTYSRKKTLRLLLKSWPQIRKN